MGVPDELERESKESVVLKVNISRRRKEVKILYINRVRKSKMEFGVGSQNLQF